MFYILLCLYNEFCRWLNYFFTWSKKSSSKDSQNWRIFIIHCLKVPQNWGTLIKKYLFFISLNLFELRIFPGIFGFLCTRKFAWGTCRNLVEGSLKILTLLKIFLQKFLKKSPNLKKKTLIIQKFSKSPE